MGEAISTARDLVIQGSEKENAVKLEQLKMLEQMANDRLETARNNFLNGRRGDQEIHAGTVVDFETFISVNVDEKSEMGDQLIETISRFFSGEAIGAIKNALTTAANVVLGSKAIGKSEQNQMMVLWDNNALIRVDVYHFKYRFSSEEVMSAANNVYASLAMKRVINLSEVRTPVLVYSVTKAATLLDKEQTQLDELVAKVKKLTLEMKKLQEIDHKMKEDESKNEE